MGLFNDFLFDVHFEEGNNQREQLTKETKRKTNNQENTSPKHLQDVKIQSCVAFHYNRLFQLVSLYLSTNASNQELTLF